MKRWDWAEKEMVEANAEGEFVYVEDHLAAVEQARREAFAEALEEWRKPFTRSVGPNGEEIHSYRDWLRARAEGEP